MTKEDLKKEIKEILELVKLCPQELQSKCFEILLAAALSHREAPRGDAKSSKPTSEGESGGGDLPAEIEKRIRTFGGQHGMPKEDILKSYQIDEAGGVSIEVTDLKTAKTSKRQKSLALLIAGRHHFMEGSFDVPIEELRQMCVTYGAYDAANFKANLKNAREIFAGFKPDSTNKLSPKGKSELAELLKSLVS